MLRNNDLAALYCSSERSSALLGKLRTSQAVADALALFLPASALTLASMGRSFARLAWAGGVDYEQMVSLGW